jgi:predicted phage baseplate assembly protein
VPLASHFPVLDDRRFDDIVEEARTRIPRYTPEWTDYNPGDCGFALIELFAWMTELLAFRLNQLPKLTYLKFLQLVGIELRPARSATTILTFPVQQGFSDTVVTVPSRSQVATAEPDEEGHPIIFETERTLTALRAKLDSVQSNDGYSYTLLTAANEALDDGFAPFGPLATTGSFLLLGFNDEVGEFPPGAELALAFWPKRPHKDPPPAPCGGAATAIPSPARIVWEAWAGSEWRPLNILLDETLGFTRSGLVLLQTPGKGQASRAKLGAATDKPRYWLRAKLSKSAYQTPPLLLGVRATAVRASEEQTASDEVLGGSDGTPDQVFTISNAPIVPESLVLEVFEGEQPQVWKPVEDFFGWKAEDAVYVPNWATGEIRFPGIATPSSGKGGRIPVANLDRPTSSVVARTYRFGGGKRGNVGAGTITAPMTVVAGIDVAGVSNPLAATGGADEEDIEVAMERAPRILKARDRAVTSGDFELLAMETGSIARAKALPLFHPDFPGIDVPGVVTVVVVPEIIGSREAQLLVPATRPVESLLRTICNYLDARRLLTTELYVVGPVYVPVSLRLEAVVTPGADAAEASNALTQAMRRFFHPLFGGVDGKGWPFGGTIRYADLYRAALVKGIQRLSYVEIIRDNQPFGQCMDVPIEANALIELVDVSITVSEDLAEALA